MVGEQVGSYRLLEKLGAGGMGVVWIGQHVALGRKAAIKMIRPELSGDESLLRRFFNEARSAAEIDHPGLVSVLDFGRHTDGSAFIVMELLTGETLGARLRREGKLPPAVAGGIARQIATTLALVHDRGTIHRDLKPDNVFLVPDDEVALGVRVKLLDFGIAKLRGGAGTATGAIIGTPAYMSPEQCRGAATVDARADVYSLGCMLFEMVSGRRPFLGDSHAALIGAQLYETPPSLRTLDTTIPSPLEALIAAMLAKDPADRPADMRAVLAAIETRTSRPASAVEVAATVALATPAPEVAERSGSPRWPLVVFAAVVILAGTLTILFGLNSVKPPTRAVPDAPAPPPLLDYAGDGMRFRYSAFLTPIRTKKELGVEIELRSTRSPHILLYVHQSATVQMAETIAMVLDMTEEKAVIGNRVSREPVRRSVGSLAAEGFRYTYHLEGRTHVAETYPLPVGSTAVSILLAYDTSDELLAGDLFRDFLESFAFTAKATGP